MRGSPSLDCIDHDQEGEARLTTGVRVIVVFLHFHFDSAFDLGCRSFAMPGLLQTPQESLQSFKVAFALAAELVGTLIFSLFGSAATINGIAWLSLQ